MPKEAPVDPCRQWLGIDAIDLGNARIVLGISPQEMDPLAVVRAAEARLNLLRTIAPGPFEMARAGLIKRVEEAREKLLTEIAATPQRLRPDAAVAFAMPAPPSQRAASSPPVPATRPAAAPGMPPAVPGTVPPVPPTVPGGAFPGDRGGVETIAIRTTVYRKKTPVAGIAMTVLALSAVAGGLSYFASYGNLQARKPGGRQMARADSAAVRVGAEPEKDRRSESVERPAHKPAEPHEEEPLDPASDRAVSTSKPPSARKERSRGSEPEARREREEEPPQVVSLPTKAPPASTPKPMEEEAMAADEKPADEKPAAGLIAVENRQLDDTLSESLESLRQQEYDSVTRLLAKAAKEARGPQAGQRVASWQQLATYFKGFMDYREKALAAVKPGDEYDVINQKIGVVEVDAEKFIYRSAGGNKTVPIDKIPAGIVLAIVMQWFDSNPANNLYIGAYHLAKPEPDLQRAREHWEQAQAAGADASDLMPLLDDPVFARSE